jgi:glycosyltransferase involved in cell wall biosynthesis
MRILLLAPHPFFINRGTPIDVDILARALSHDGHQVDLVCYPEGEERAYTGVTIHRVRAPAVLHGTPPGFTWKKVMKDLLMIPTVLRLVKEHDYDIVHAGEEAVLLAMLLEKVRGIPYIYDMDSSIAQQMVEQMPILSPLASVLNWVEAVAIRGAVATAPVCNALADLSRERGAALIETLHDISQLEDPLRKPTGFLRRELGIDGPIIMYVGNLQRYQGVDLLLKSLAITLRAGTELDLVIAGGSDADIQRYSTLTTQLGIGSRVHFLGPWPLDDLEVLLAEADILTAPRITGINTPMKVFPYLHTGKPVLLTDLRTHNQILHSSVAVLAPADPQGFASAMQELVRNPELRRERGRRGREFVEANHTFSAHLARVRRLYDAVAARVASGATPGAGADAGFTS